jgi:hypothetical protein
MQQQMNMAMMMAMVSSMNPMAANILRISNDMNHQVPASNDEDCNEVDS